jgi:ABC-2 type transport system permease protein/sodium transport system permease protein
VNDAATRPTTGWDVGRLLRFARKELREVLRDRRTVLTLLLMPLLLYPLLAIGLGALLQPGAAPAAPEYRIAFDSPEAFRRFQGLADAASRAEPRGRPRDGDAAPQAARLTPFQAEDMAEDVRHGKAHLGLRFRPLQPGQPDPYTSPAPWAEWEVFVLEGSAESEAAMRQVRALIADANLDVCEVQLRRPDGRPRRPAVLTRLTMMKAPPARGGGVANTLLPLVLILMTITGAVYPAIDLTAGERERGTLEMLMAAPVPRVGLLLAKYVAVLAVTLLTAVVNLVMLVLTTLASGLGPLLFGPDGLTAALALKVFGLMLLFGLFFAAVLLAITSFARSFKEAQAYLIPLMLVSIAPGVAALLPDMQLAGPLSVTPLMNVVLLGRDLLDGKPDLAGPAAAVVGSTLLYAAAAIALAARVFGAEAVLYSDGGGWGDLFRRPAEPSDAATPGAALLCLALLFPAQFLLGGLAAQAPLAPIARLTVQAGLAVLLFAGFPLAAARLGRVRPRAGLALRAPPALAWPAALLLGVSLWPFAAELAELLRSAAPLPQALRDRASELLASWREAGAVPTLLCLAVVPAVTEELLFRGYLFTALRRALPPAATVLTTAAAFGLFHLLLGGFLTWERGLVAALLGAALGCVRLWSGSVLPGMLLHATHNGLLLLAGLKGAEAQAWVVEGGHVRAAWLLAGAVGAAVGALLLFWASRDKAFDRPARRPHTERSGAPVPPFA